MKNDLRTCAGCCCTTGDRDIVGSGGALQILDDIPVVDDYLSGQSAALPVGYPLRVVLLSVDAEKLGESQVSTGSFDYPSGLFLVHGGDLNMLLKPSSNTLCKSLVNEPFTITAMPPPSTSQNVLSKLKDWVKRERLKPGEAAERLDVEHGRYTNWLRRGVPPKEYPRVAKAIGCTLDELLAGSPTSSAPPPPPDGPLAIIQEHLETLEPEDQAMVARFVGDLVSRLEERTKPKSRSVKRPVK